MQELQELLPGNTDSTIWGSWRVWGKAVAEGEGKTCYFGYRHVYLKFFVNTEVGVNVLLRSQKGEGSLEKAINPPFPSTKVHQMSSVGGWIRCGDLVAISFSPL